MWNPELWDNSQRRFGKAVKVLLDEWSFDTWENIKNLFEMEWDNIQNYWKIYFLTSFAHAERIKLIFEKELKKFCKARNLDDKVRQQILSKVEFLNADEIMQNPVYWTQQELARYHKLFDKVEEKSLWGSHNRREAILRAVTRFPFGLKVLNYLANRGRR